MLITSKVTSGLSPCISPILVQMGLTTGLLFDGRSVVDAVAVIGDMTVENNTTMKNTTNPTSATNPARTSLRLSLCSFAMATPHEAGESALISSHQKPIQSTPEFLKFSKNATNPTNRLISSLNYDLMGLILNAKL